MRWGSTSFCRSQVAHVRRKSFGVTLGIPARLDACTRSPPYVAPRLKKPPPLLFGVLRDCSRTDVVR